MQRCVGCQHAVIAVAVQAWRRDQCGAAVALGLGQTVDDLVRVDLPNPVQGERRAGAVVQQLARRLHAAMSAARLRTGCNTGLVTLDAAQAQARYNDA